MDAISGAVGPDANTAPTTPLSVLKAGASGATSPAPAKATGISKVAENPLVQGGISAAGMALAPVLGPLAPLLIPLAGKLVGGLLGKKPTPGFNANVVGGSNGLDALAAKNAAPAAPVRSFGGM
jgi:hypothetical protein